MLRALLGILRTHDPLQAIGERFGRMLKLTLEMTLSAGDIAFGGDAAPESRTRIYDLDVEVNKLERSIRKRIVAHLSTPGSRVDVPYCLLLMSLAKDVERLGDYAKNLSEVADVREAPFPDDEVVGELGRFGAAWSRRSRRRPIFSRRLTGNRRCRIFSMDGTWPTGATR
ncbi:MAG: hypothetical protein CL477_14215 [Acidobacteria bacterium]|jgi:phosphate uptake regulator|nr:hypothetical protein [Acidobacteriota bacterium]MDP7479531.1 PhoU domain-containing protein [Vicinamibacterales bacterium]MDP7691743.1 PhoU domain-containing protein [Vicinamibacterales bacterium]HJN42747.1 PhoU domain-containing protein [Vicinamibacterales bacterium]|tara:strand:- start:23 stop:532 length:510 start_codon:yes stop_codon:yes gene_type:complete